MVRPWRLDFSRNLEGDKHAVALSVSFLLQSRSGFPGSVAKEFNESISVSPFETSCVQGIVLSP